MSYYGPIKIDTEPQALDAIGNGGRFILVGDPHTDNRGQQAFVDLMPTFERAHVRVIGLELRTSMNEFLSKTQAKIRHDLAAGRTQKQICDKTAQRLRDYFDEHNQVYATGNEHESRLDAAILYESTRHKMKVVGIDPRPDDPSYAAREDELFNSKQYEQLNKLRTSRDAEIARNASAALDGVPKGSRMAIFFGRNHLTQEYDAKTYPPVLGETLRRYGSVTTIDLALDGTHLPVTYEMNPAIGKDIGARAVRDGRKPPVKIDISN